MAFDLDRVRERLPGRPVYWQPVTGSTMLDAARLLEEGVGAGTVVGADEQTAGQGRMGRRWLSDADAGLYVTLVLRPALNVETLPVVTLALGLATAEAIQRATDMTPDLRWPNDVLIGSKKVAGILAQAQAGHLLAGIGINVNQREFPPELEPIATSLTLAGGRSLRREELLVKLVNAVDAFCTMLETDGKEPILRAFTQASSYVHGRRVTVEQGHQVLQGTTDGLDDSGFLWLREPDNRRTLIRAGGVRPA